MADLTCYCNFVVKTMILLKMNKNYFVSFYQAVIQQKLIFFIIMARIRNNTTVYQYSISICMGSFVFGYQLTNMGSINHLIASQNNVDPDDSWKTLTLINSITALFAVLGVLLYKPLTNIWGDLKTFQVFDILTIIASIIGILNLSISTQLISRIVFGLIIGMNTVLIPIYLTSTLPGSMGGPAGTLNQLFITIGILFGAFMGYLVVGSDTSETGWRIIIALPIIPSIIRLYTTKIVFPYETVERMIKDNANQSLEKYVNLIYESMTVQQFKISKKLPQEDILSEQSSLFDARSQPYLRRLFMAGGIVLFNQLCGMGALGSYGSEVFGQVVGQNNESILTVFVYLYLVQVIVTFISGRYLEDYGRRAFMATGQKIIIVSLFLVGVLDLFAPNLYIISFILIFIHMIGFSICYGPCSFLIGTEILHDATLPGVILWLGIFSLNFINTTFISAIGVGLLCLIYCFFQVIGYAYVSSYLVQTQGTPRSQVYAGFRKQCVNDVTKSPIVIHRSYEGGQNYENELQMKFIPNKKNQEQF